jgi:hypothetical protein
MSKHTIFLKNALFTLPGEAGHVPVGATIVEGAITGEFSPGVAIVKCDRFLDERGRALPEKAVVILLPWAKVDHVHVKD